MQQPVAPREQERVEQHLLALAEIVALVPLAEGHVGLVAQQLPCPTKNSGTGVLGGALEGARAALWGSSGRSFALEPDRGVVRKREGAPSHK